MNSRIIEEDVQSILKELGKNINAFENKDILITGASGMLASYMVYVLIKANETVFKKPCRLHLVVRSKTGKFSNNKNIQFYYRNIAKEDLGINKKMDYIIHAASKAAPKLYTTNNVDTINTNIKGLYKVLDLVSKKTKSILFFSSGEIYGQINFNKSITEEYIGLVDHLNKRSCYVEGKRACESICINYFWEKKYPIKIARIFHTFGPGLNLNDGRVFSDFTKNVLRGNNIEIKGDKNIVRPYLYIADATVMFFKLLLSTKNGEIYNVANDKNVVTVLQLAKTIANCFNKIKPNSKVKVKVTASREDYYKNAFKYVIPNTKKFVNFFKYEPKTSIYDGFSRTILYYLSNNTLNKK